MLLESAIIKLTSHLDSITRQKDSSVSSHGEIKKKTLECITEIIARAPDPEVYSFSKSDDYQILLGYLFNTLCQILRDDKSRIVKKQTLDTICAVLNRFQHAHHVFESDDGCCLEFATSILPGVSSSLFRMIMKDTKTPTSILTGSIKALSSVIILSLHPCRNTNRKHTEEEDICNNLAIRIDYMINYIMSNADTLSHAVLEETMSFCDAIVAQDNATLLSRTIGSIIKFVAYNYSSGNHSYEPGEMTRSTASSCGIVDRIRGRIESNDCDTNLDATVISHLLKLIDGLSNDQTNMLTSERQSKLAYLSGLLRMLPESSFNSIFELEERRTQITNLLIDLCEFSLDQPFLCLTETSVSSQAVETPGKSIYMIEKRYQHMTNTELVHVRSICQTIGRTLSITQLMDYLHDELLDFLSPEVIHIAQMVLRGLCDKPLAHLGGQTKKAAIRFVMQTVNIYVERLHELYAAAGDIVQADTGIQSQFATHEDNILGVLTIVIAIESLADLLDVHLRLTKDNKAAKTIVLKGLLSSLLNWASARSRAISEAALSTLNKISRLYGFDSMKVLLEDNIDYIVDDVSKMLNNFSMNPQIAHVLALTFKLSSRASLFYFKDVYERVFQLTAMHQQSGQIRYIAMLIHRTLTILAEWDDAEENSQAPNELQDPLECKEILDKVIDRMDIDKRIGEIRDEIKRRNNIKQNIEQLESDEKVGEKLSAESDPEKILRKFKDDAREQIEREEAQHVEEEPPKKAEKPMHIELTERMMRHCVMMLSSPHDDTKIIALKTAACGMRLLRNQEDILLPLVHELWTPLVRRLTAVNSKAQTRDADKLSGVNLNVNLCAYECLISMALYAKDFIKRRTLDTIIPRLCVFLDVQLKESRKQRECDAYCMSIAYKSQLRILTHIGQLAYEIDLNYADLWRVIRSVLAYVRDETQVEALRRAAKHSAHYLMALDPDCVWYFAQLAPDVSTQLPFELIYALPSFKSSPTLHNNNNNR